MRRLAGRGVRIEPEAIKPATSMPIWGMNNPQLEQFGGQLNGLTPGKLWSVEFRVLKNPFGKADDAATEEAARKFGKLHHCTFRHEVEQGHAIFEHANS